MNTILLGSRTWACPNRIKLLRADINYTHVHFFEGKPKWVSTTLKTLQERLPSDGFLRVNRKELVNLGYVKKYRMTRDRDYVELSDGEILIPSRRGRLVLREFFKKDNTLKPFLNV